MKKQFCILLAVAALLSLTACKIGEEGDTVSPSAKEPQEADSEPEKSGDDMDVDLTELSSTMVYSEIYNMMYTPEKYVGKTVKMKGAFAVGYSYKPDGTMDESSILTSCIVMDATACCSQGIEFVLSGEHTYPDDYPALNDEIVITGVFDTYEKNGFKFCHLVDAELIK